MGKKSLLAVSNFFIRIMRMSPTHVNKEFSHAFFFSIKISFNFQEQMLDSDN